MRVLLDNNVTQALGIHIVGHEVVHARELGWADLKNGDLITQAEAHGFEALVTADRQMQYQQNISGRKLSIVLLRNWRITLIHLLPLVPNLLKALSELQPGEFRTVTLNQ